MSPPTVELAVAAAVLLGAAAQAVTGIGFSLVCVPLVALALGGKDAVRLANVLAVAVNVLMLAREGRGVDVRRVAVLLLPAVVVVPATARAIRYVGTDLLTVVSSSLVLLAIAALARRTRIPGLAGVRGAVTAGAVSAAMNVAGGVGGPAVASYALNEGWRGGRFRASLAAYFLVLNVLSVAARGAPHESSTFYALVAVALVAGFAAGALVSRRLDHETVRTATLVVAAAGAVAAIARTLA